MDSEQQKKKTLAFVIYPGFTMLDLVGTQGFLKGLEASKQYEVVIVGARTDPLDSDTPLKVIAQKTFDDLSHPFGIVVPGGGGLATLEALGDGTLRDYIRAAGESAEWVVSVSTGSLLLAAVGLLEGRQATTHWAYAHLLERLGARYVQKRWVEDGRFITSAGGTAGMDMALSLLAKVQGEARARASQVMAEYDPEPPFGGIEWSRVDRNALAPVLARQQAALEQALAGSPELLEKLAIRQHQPAR